MEEIEYTGNEEKLFVKGFNDGYKLRQHEPALLNTLLKGVSGHSPRLDGIRAGSNQWEHDAERERIRESLTRRQELHPSKDRNKDRER